MEFSPYALHFSGDATHKPVVLLGVERERPDGIIWGGSVFSNSFGQPSGSARATRLAHGCMLRQ